MRYSRFIILFGLVLCLAIWLGCSKSSSPTGPNNPPAGPTVASVSPINGATNVATGSTVTATFSADLDAGTVTASSFSLNNSMTGTVSYANKVATYTPSHALNANTTYTATLTTAIKSADGTAMSQNYSWSFTTAAPTAVTWVRTFGQGHEGTYRTAKTNDGGYAAAGTVFGDIDSLLLLKVDQLGNQTLHKTVPGGRATALAVKSDNSITLAGVKYWHTPSYDQSGDSAILAQFDNPGNLAWRKSYGPGSFRAVCVASDNGFIAAGTDDSEYTNGIGNILVVKTDAAGTKVWSKIINGAGNERAEAILATNDGGCVIAGSTSSSGAGDEDFYLIRLNSSGEIVWQKTYGGANEENGMGLTATDDGGYLICGMTRSFGGGTPDQKVTYVVKTDASGNFVWQNTYGTNEGILNDVDKTTDGGYILTGYGYFSGLGYDLILLKINATGAQLWQKTYNNAQDELGYGVVSTSDGGYLAAGRIGAVSSITGNALMIKSDASGNW